jgi:hypothetical protein
MGLVLVVGCESLERMASEAAPVGKGVGTLVSVRLFHSYTYSCRISIIEQEKYQLIQYLTQRRLVTAYSHDKTPIPFHQPNVYTHASKLPTRPLQATLNSAPTPLTRPLRVRPNVTERLPNMAHMDDLKTLLDLDR